MLFGALLLVHFLQVLSVSGLPTEAIWRDPYTVTKNPNGLKAHLPTGLRHRKVHGSSPKNDLIGLSQLARCDQLNNDSYLHRAKIKQE
ncbi:hypothetical protein MJO29_007697 [Puccinia striiformis f. sp. tritici]|uniref:Secreted protein n=1 Tax=Puccinia striiformis TaxID=27350 RepID=A0A2S4WLE9_9BASI|nr:hypothetical protein MJO29_007697 [Puccinia striiformis f. sp. tritici]POW22620.1 hypothetical protein PSHT_01095 [Puccinia striiformis]